LAEAESELVAGFLTEYSGMRWSFFFLAEYASMFLVSGLATVLFLGGWDDGFGILGVVKANVGSFVANALGLVIFLKKASLLVCVQIWVRWTLPRLRIDQVMTTCLKYLIPISCVLFAGTVAYPFVLVKMSGNTSILGEPSGNRVVQPHHASVGSGQQTQMTAAAAERSGR
jgi:NADH-quinone oxidoreductase subunit H